MELKDVNWGSVANWVSGLGSFSAALIALYLARSSQRVRLSGFCGHRIVVGGGGPRQELISIRVTNVGSRSTVISNIGIRIGRFKKRYAIITVVRDTYSAGIPKPLGDGEEAHWGIPLDEKKSWITDLCKDFIKSEADVESMRIEIHTTNGGTTDLRPEKPLRQMIIDSLKKSDG